MKHRGLITTLLTALLLLCALPAMAQMSALQLAGNVEAGPLFHLAG